MTITTRALTARIAHTCDGCQWALRLRDVAAIAPGHRYLRPVWPDCLATTAESGGSAGGED